MAERSKQRKVDAENRQFNKEWTDKWLFVLPVGGMKPMCLICNATADLAFLVDMMEHMNVLNLKLQGRGKPVTELWPCVKAFIMKLDVFKEDVLTGGDHHFQTLKHFISEWEDFDPATLQSYADFISQIANEFQKRFSQFQGITAVIDLVNKPLAADPQGAWKQQVAQVADLSIGCIQLQPCDLHALEKETVSVEFWIQEDICEKYPDLTKFARKVLTCFGSTYVCEAVFSNLQHIKSKNRSTLTQEHTNNLMRIASSTFKPNFDDIVQNINAFHSSH